MRTTRFLSAHIASSSMMLCVFSAGQVRANANTSSANTPNEDLDLLAMCRSLVAIPSDLNESNRAAIGPEKFTHRRDHTRLLLWRDTDPQRQRQNLGAEPL